MFSALNQGSLIYILDKTDGLKYKTGEVVGTTVPTNFNSPFQNLHNGNITIKVKIDGNVVDYPEVPSNNTVASYNNGNIIISETKSGLQNEVENIIQSAKQILSNREYYEKQIKDGEDILKSINPQFAKDKERDDRIDGLDSKVTSMESKLDKILNALTNNNNPTIKL